MANKRSTFSIKNGVMYKDGRQVDTLNKDHDEPKKETEETSAKKKKFLGRLGDKIENLFSRDKKMEASAYAYGCNDDGTLKKDGTPNFGTTATSSQIPASEKEYTIATKDGMKNGTIYKLTNTGFQLPDGSHPSAVYLKTDTAGRNKIDIYSGVGTEALAIQPKIENGRVTAISNKNDKSGADVYLKVEILGSVDLKNTEAFKKTRALTHNLNAGHATLGELAEVPTFKASKSFEANKNVTLNSYSEEKKTQMLAKIEESKQAAEAAKKQMAQAAPGYNEVTDKLIASINTKIPYDAQHANLPKTLAAASGNSQVENAFANRPLQSTLIETKQPPATQTLASVRISPEILAGTSIGGLIVPSDVAAARPPSKDAGLSGFGLGKMLLEAEAGKTVITPPLAARSEKQAIVAAAANPAPKVPDVKEPEIEIRRAIPTYASVRQNEFASGINKITTEVSAETTRGKRTEYTASVHKFLDHYMEFEVKDRERGFYGPKTIKSITELQSLGKAAGVEGVEVDGRVTKPTLDMMLRIENGELSIAQLRELAKSKKVSFNEAAEEFRKTGAVAENSLPNGTEVSSNVTGRPEQAKEQIIG